MEKEETSFLEQDINQLEELDDPSQANWVVVQCKDGSVKKISLIKLVNYINRIV